MSFPHSQQLPQSSSPSLAPPPASRFSRSLQASTMGLPSACLSTSIMGQQPPLTKAALSNSPSHVSSHPPPPHYFRQPLPMLLRHPSSLLLLIPVSPTFRNPNLRKSLWGAVVALPQHTHGASCEGDHRESTLNLFFPGLLPQQHREAALMEALRAGSVLL